MKTIDQDNGVRLALIGSRNFRDYKLFCESVQEALLDWKINSNDLSCVVSGGASGADALAERWALEKGLKISVFRADWKSHGRRAGPLRNSEIVKYATHLVAFPSHNGSGTQDTIRKAQLEGKPIKIIYVKSKSLGIPCE